jgi:O-antigen biosynthesis protein
MEPLVTVCILSQDPEAAVKVGIFKQTYKNYEVILANKPGIVPAMNEALSGANGEIFVRIDDDVELPPEWLNELVKPFFHPKVAGVTGPTFVPFLLRGYRDSLRAAYKPSRFLRWMFDGQPYAPAKIYKCGSVSYGSNFLDRLEGCDHQIDHLEGTNWAMRTALIREVGGFDPKFDGVAEWFDSDVVMKIRKKGYRIVYSNKAFLWHMVKKGDHYEERFHGWGRMKNWLRFHWRHSWFHPKMIIWFSMMGGYFLWQQFQRSFQQLRGEKTF